MLIHCWLTGVGQGLFAQRKSHARFTEYSIIHRKAPWILPWYLPVDSKCDQRTMPLQMMTVSIPEFCCYHDHDVSHDAWFQTVIMQVSHSWNNYEWLLRRGRESEELKPLEKVLYQTPQQRSRSQVLMLCLQCSSFVDMQEMGISEQISGMIFCEETIRRALAALSVLYIKATSMEIPDSRAR